MYVTLRRYAEVGARMYEIVARRVEEGLVPTLKGQPGFRCYCAFVSADGDGVSMTVFDARGQAARANERVRGWGLANLRDLLAVPGLRKDGSRVSLEFTIVPLRDEEGRMEGMAAVLRDVTRRFEEMRALRRELAAARAGTSGAA